MSTQEKIRVLHLGSPGGLFGAERWILSLIRELNPAAVHSVVGVINDAHYTEIALCTEASKSGFDVCEIHAPGRLNVAAISRLRRLLQDMQIDIVHTHFYKTDIVGYFATRGTRCKIVSTPHGWDNRPSRSLWLYQNLSRLFFPFLDAVAPLSDGLYAELAKIPGMERKLRLIANAVDIGEVESETRVDAGLQELKNKGKFIIGYIGRLSEAKELETLLETMAHHGHAAWELVLVGSGEHSDALETMADQLHLDDRVHFTGFRADRLALLRGFDTFVLPSRSEGIPRCVMEAMAAGVPVIATDIAGCRALIDDRENGLLFPVGDARALAQCIRQVEGGEIDGAGLARNARRRIREDYSAARMARQYETLYSAVVSASLRSGTAG
jgi:glycosyltransferase involved in cell wall biosynthesis